MTQTNARLVAIAIPSGDMVHADFAMSLATLCFNPGVRAFVINAKSSLVMVGRNQCVEAARMAKATHILFLDSDLTFPPNILARLLARNKDIVGGLYIQRVPPHLPLGVTYEGAREVITSGLRRMQQMPTGCLLINLSVFDQLPKPWFNTKQVDDKIMGEDYYFCERALQAGFEIWCDGDVSREIAHVGQKSFVAGAQ